MTDLAPRIGYGVATVAVWWLLGAVFWARRRRLLDVREGDRVGRGIRLLNLLILVLVLAPALALLPLAAGRHFVFHFPTATSAGGGNLPMWGYHIPIFGAGWEAFRWVFGLVLMPLFVSQLTGGMLVALRPPPGRVRLDEAERKVEILAVVAVAWFFVVEGAVGLIYLLDLRSLLWCLPLAFVGAAGAVFIFGRAQRAVPGRDGKPHEMDDTPLRRELERMGEAIGVVPKSIKVLPVRDATPGGQRSRLGDFQRLHRWWLRFQPREPTVPLPVLRMLPARSVTAALAVRYAAHDYVLPVWARDQRGAALRVAAWLVIALLGLVVFLQSTFMGGWGIPGLVVLTPAVVVGLHQALRFLRRLVVVSGRLQTYERALELWRLADPGEERRGVELLCGLAQLNRALNLSVEPEIVVRMVFNLTKGMTEFAARCGRQEAESAVRAAIAEIDKDLDWIPPGATGGAEKATEVAADEVAAPDGATGDSA